MTRNLCRRDESQLKSQPMWGMGWLATKQAITAAFPCKSLARDTLSFTEIGEEAPDRAARLTDMTEKGVGLLCAAICWERMRTR